MQGKHYTHNTRSHWLDYDNDESSSENELQSDSDDDIMTEDIGMKSRFKDGCSERWIFNLHYFFLINISRHMNVFKEMWSYACFWFFVSFLLKISYSIPNLCMVSVYDLTLFGLSSLQISVEFTIGWSLMNNFVPWVFVLTIIFLFPLIL